MVNPRRPFTRDELFRAAEAVAAAATTLEGAPDQETSDEELRAYGFEPEALLAVAEEVTSSLLQFWPDKAILDRVWIECASAVTIGCCIVGQALNNREDD